jgi:hypothetical protein
MRYVAMIIPWLLVGFLGVPFLLIAGYILCSIPYMFFAGYLSYLLCGALPGCLLIWLVYLVWKERFKETGYRNRFVQLRLGTILGLAFISGLLLGPNFQPRTRTTWSGVPPQVNSIQNVYGYPFQVYGDPIQYLGKSEERLAMCGCHVIEGIDYQALSLLIGGNLSMLLFSALVLEGAQRIYPRRRSAESLAA